MKCVRLYGFRSSRSRQLNQRHQTHWSGEVLIDVVSEKRIALTPDYIADLGPVPLREVFLDTGKKRSSSIRISAVLPR